MSKDTNRGDRLLLEAILDFQRTYLIRFMVVPVSKGLQESTLI